MKKQVGIWLVIVLSTISVHAQSIFDSISCSEVRKTLDLPYFYCDCKESAIPFAFPYDTVISDTVWFTASYSDLKNGLSAYWFADCSITMEVYAFCASKIPTISLTVGANQMRDIDVTKINQKLDEMGEAAKAMAETLTPYMRAYPNKIGGSGRVYCYPYDQGPHSTCEDPIPFLPGMTYVCDKEQNSYRMEYSRIPASGQAFIHWKQKQNKPCDVWLTLDSCAGEEIGRTHLSDSLHVYMLDSLALRAARQDKRTIWVHVSHAPNMTGRLYWYNNPKYTEETLPAVNKSTCYGKTISVNLRTYATDTAFTDLLWVARDTLTTQDVSLTFTEPTVEYDTVYVLASAIHRGYRYTPSGDVFTEFGDYTVEVKKNNTCTRIIQVTVAEKIEDPEPPQPPQPPTPPEEGLDNISTTRRATKHIENGQIVLYINGHKYDLLGQQLN